MISTKLTLLLIACYSLSFVFSFYNHKSKFLSTWTFIKKEIVIKNHKSALIVLLSTSPQNENNIRVNSTSSASSSINESSSPVLFGGEGDDYFNISSSVDQASEFRDIFTNYKKRIEKEMRSFSKRSFSVIDGSFAGDIGFDPLGRYMYVHMYEIDLSNSR